MCKLRDAAVVCVALVGAMAHGAKSDEIGPTTPIPDIVQRATAVYNTSTRGVIGMQRHFTTVVHVGPIHHTETSDSGFLMRDGSYLGIKYYRVADDGRSLSADEMGSRDSQTNRDWAAGKIFFKEPYDSRFMGDYQFEETPSCQSCLSASCPMCPADTVTVNFTSAVHDMQHGNGTMWIDPATAHVVRLTYTPNELPPHATSASITETSTEVMPNVWYVTRIEGTYTGRKFFLRGSATFIGTFDHFARFSDGSEAADALGKGTI